MKDPVPPPTYLVISQVFQPDPAAVGQYMTEAAVELSKRGYRVVTYASARGYDDPTIRYKSRENLDGVDVRRLPLSSFGKSSIAVRLIAQWIFVAQAVIRGLFTRNLAGVLVTTSPPFAGFAGAIISKVRGVPVKYWLMDLNPDQIIAMGKAKPGSLMVRVFEFFNRTIFKQASDIIMLDRFMLKRVEAKGVPGIAAKTTVMPPWPMEGELASVPHEENPFRVRHNLAGKFVIMYSGNHSPANPLTTLLDAAERFKDDPRVVFYFIGGGGAKAEVDARIAAGAKNIVSLPYQPLSEIRYSLSAADVHVASIGSDVVGIVHPCKVYGAMAVARPVLLLGPNPSHVSDLLTQHRMGWHVNHGDVNACEHAIRQMLATAPAELAAMGQRARTVIDTSLSKQALCDEFTSVLMRGVRRP